jgi:hypothetical protein
MVATIFVRLGKWWSVLFYTAKQSKLDSERLR